MTLYITVSLVYNKISTNMFKTPTAFLFHIRSKPIKLSIVKVSLEYQDGTRTDGEETTSITTDWQYKLHTITVDYSGRYLRTVKLDLSEMSPSDEVWVSDFNIILLSSVANFGDASKIRVGKLNGITDPVFGQLEGYGGYLQKLLLQNLLIFLEH